MKVAIIVSSIKQLGPVKVMETLVKSFIDYQDIQIEVFYLDKRIDPEIHFAVTVKLMDVRTFPFEDYDIIHTNGIRPDLLAYRHRKRIKYYISTIHNFVFEDFKYTYSPFISIVFGTIWLMLWRRADKLVCVSYVMKKYYEKWVPSSRLEVVHNGISGSDVSNTLDNDIVRFIEDSRSSGMKVIGTACMLTKRKGLEQIIDTLVTEKNYSFMIIGEGKELPNLTSLAHKLNISDRCFFCGFRSNAIKYFHLFDIFIMPSRSEGFGLALIEAIHEKVPVICSDISVFRELFTTAEVTFFRIDDKLSLIQSLKEAEDTGFKKLDLSFKRVEKDYNASVMAEKYYNIYQSAMS